MITMVLGTRPEIIKFSPLIKFCEEEDIEYMVIHTGQHYSWNLSAIFLNELRLPKPDFNLGVGSGTHAEETGKMMVGIEKILKDFDPEVVLVQGDTNTALAGAITAAKLHIDLGHVEAGLRSWDRMMPEELNRIMIDHISDYSFAPTSIALDNLENEGIKGIGVSMVGNTIADVLRIYSPKLKIGQNKHILVTVHREENVDDRNRLHTILCGIQETYAAIGLPVIFPLHPRTQKRINQWTLGELLTGINVVEPVGYLNFLELEANAALILTDSGTVQEEACILGTPCITLRNSTERQETIYKGANILAKPGMDVAEIARNFIDTIHPSDHPYGDGYTAKRIMTNLGVYP